MNRSVSGNSARKDRHCEFKYLAVAIRTSNASISNIFLSGLVSGPSLRLERTRLSLASCDMVPTFC